MLSPHNMQHIATKNKKRLHLVSLTDSIVDACQTGKAPVRECMTRMTSTLLSRDQKGFCLF